MTSVKVILQQIYEEQRRTRNQIDDLKKAFCSLKSVQSKIELPELLSIPDHLRKSYLAVKEKGECSAEAVADLTLRARALESGYLNQLVHMGWLSKKRVCRTVYFFSLPNL